MKHLHFLMIFAKQFSPQVKPYGLVVVVDNLPSGIARVVAESNSRVALDAFEWLDFSNCESVKLAVIHVSP